MFPRPQQQRPSHPSALKAARSLLEHLEISSPEQLDLELVAAYLGVLVLKQPLHHQEGCLLRAGNRGVIAISQQAYDSHKWRFVLAHELGHFLMHPETDQFALCTSADVWSRYKASRTEAEANVFAAELLMPKSLMEPLCDCDRPSLHDISAIAERFQTSLTSTALRFIKFSDEPCAVVHSSHGKVDWYHKTDDFLVPLRRGMKIDRDTYAADLFSGQRVADRHQAVDPDGWCDGRYAHRVTDAVLLHEHSRQVSPTSVLTLLWHPYCD